MFRIPAIVILCILASLAGTVEARQKLCSAKAGSPPLRPSRLESFFQAKLPWIESQLELSPATQETASKFLTEVMNYTVMAGGKRLRPMLILVMARKYKLSDESVLALIRGVEYLHSASLIMDDLPQQDNAQTRRGIPANHIRHGEAPAQLGFFALSMEAFSGLDELREHFSDSQVLDVMIYWAQSIGGSGMTLGQMQDLVSEEFTELDDIAMMVWRKTGIAIEASILPVAILAGASAREVKALRRLAFNLGLIYQIKDDLMDVLGASARTGKDQGADARNGRRNFVSILGLEGAQKLLDALYLQTLGDLNRVPGEKKLLRDLIHFFYSREA